MSLVSVYYICTYSELVNISTVPIPTVTISPSDPIQGAMVGSPQVFLCTVNTVNGVESSLVTISWIGPEGYLTNNSRITTKMEWMEYQIEEHTVKYYSSTLHFNYLMEGDVAIYTCNVAILQTVNFQTTEIKSVTGKYIAR